MYYSWPLTIVTAETLPHEYTRNSVCYVGTHDNAPIMLWKATAREQDIKNAQLYFGLNEQEGFNWGFIRAGLGSVSDLFVAQMQDYLGLAENSRINKPGIVADNWEWRLLENQLSTELSKKLKCTQTCLGGLNHG